MTVSQLFILVLTFVFVWGGVSCSVSVSVSWMGKTYPPIWFVCDCLVEDLKRMLVEDRWSLFLLLLLLRIGLDFPAVSCPDDSHLSPSLSLTGVLLWDSYIGANFFLNNSPFSFFA